jgi:hypothetical protein
MLIDMGIIVSDSEMEAMLREYDANHDGVLSEEEFIMLLRCVTNGLVACMRAALVVAVCVTRVRMYGRALSVLLCLHLRFWPATSQAVVT